MIRIRADLTPTSLAPKVVRLFELSAAKVRSLEHTWAPENGSPVCTVAGRYASRGWTEWTQGFQFGSAILQFDATGEREFLYSGRERTVSVMAPHLSHTGVHDHGFNNVSTYGNLLRLMNEGRTPENEWERNFYEVALKCSGAVQAARWSRRADGGGYIYSFNGPHSLFVDTIRSARALVVAHLLGHALMGENDRKISLLDRALEHAVSTARFSVYYGAGRDAYDVRGRTAHESIFNTNDGNFRCPNSQQGYSPFSTWTRGLAWATCGFAEQLEFLDTLPNQKANAAIFEEAARATCDFYIENTPPDGIPYWDTGAPGLADLGDWRDRPADPYNVHEPVDSSAAAIAAQGLLRLGHRLSDDRYWRAGLTVCDTLFDEPYLSTDAEHQGLILHSVYHRPNAWNSQPGESSMWGDYHARELGLYLLRLARNAPYLTFFSAARSASENDRIR
jgi:unsaturated chondroitin disaccharide hydrolase